MTSALATMVLHVLQALVCVLIDFTQPPKDSIEDMDVVDEPIENPPSFG